MAPSARSAVTRTRKARPAQPKILGFAKVTKSFAVPAGRKGVKLTIENVDPLSEVFTENEIQQLAAANSTAIENAKKKRIDADARKRKRGNYASEAEESETEEIPVGKKVKLFLPTPPSSDESARNSPEVTCCSCSRYDRSPSPPPMPQGLRDLREIHAAFVKAFSLHRAHNGPAAPAELNELMQSITRLYKKTSVNKEDIQHMLAIYEAEEKTEIPPKASLLCKESPFKLMTSGVGSNRRNFVEYVKGIESGNSLYEFDAKRLHNFYKGALDMIYVCGRSNRHSFIHGPVSDYPLLAFAVGSQTAARQQKASELRKHVLNKAPERATTPEFSNLSITGPDSPPQASKAVKSRTLSLFERVKAKQTANAAMAAPTSEAILRKHAIARMDEVVEIMKMKQQQKLNNEIFGAAYCSGPETPLRRVSFTMTELVKIVKASMVNPIGSEELQTCITIVAREVPGFWLRRLDMDGVLCVVLQGNGPVGMDVQRMMKAKESRKLDAEICDVETS